MPLQDSLRSDQECLVSSFVSMINVSKHDEAFLIIEQSDVVQHMPVHLLSHLDHSIFICCISSISSSGLDKTSIS